MLVQRRDFVDRTVVEKKKNSLTESQFVEVFTLTDMKYLVIFLNIFV